MNRKRNLPVWLKGGMLATAFCIVFAVTLFYFQDEVFSPVFFPILFVTILVLAMRDTPASGIELIFVTGLGITLQIVMYFVIGTMIGSIVQKVQNKYLKLGIVLIILLSVPLIMMKLKIQERQWRNTTLNMGLPIDDLQAGQKIFKVA